MNKNYTILLKDIREKLNKSRDIPYFRTINLNVGNIDQLPLTCPQLGTRPTTQTCALTGYRTSRLSVCRPALTPLTHTSQGKLYIFKNIIVFSIVKINE